MSSTSEKGHVKNIANFGRLIAIIQNMAHYNPVNPLTTISALQELHTDADARVRSVGDILSLLTIAVDTREATFKGLDKLVTRVSGAVASQKDSAALLADVKTINSKIRGDRSKSSKKQKLEDVISDNIRADKAISTSQRSYTNLEAHFSRLISLLSQSGYTVNESDLTIASLTALQERMIESNAAVTNAGAQLGQARMVRDTKLYALETGLVDIAYDVKSYVKSMSTQGASSPEYRQIANIRFSRSKA